MTANSCRPEAPDGIRDPADLPEHGADLIGHPEPAPPRGRPHRRSPARSRARTPRRRAPRAAGSHPSRSPARGGPARACCRVPVPESSRFSSRRMSTCRFDWRKVCELEQERLAVERLAEELPGARPIGLEALGAARRPRRRDDDRRRAAEPRIAAQRAADLEPVHVRHLGVEDDDVRLGSAGPLERLLPGIGADHRVAVRPEDALERPGRPFLIVGDQDQRERRTLFSRCAIQLVPDGGRSDGDRRPRTAGLMRAPAGSGKHMPSSMLRWSIGPGRDGPPLTRAPQFAGAGATATLDAELWRRTSDRCGPATTAASGSTPRRPTLQLAKTSDRTIV